MSVLYVHSELICLWLCCLVTPLYARLLICCKFSRIDRSFPSGSVLATPLVYIGLNNKVYKQNCCYNIVLSLCVTDVSRQPHVLTSKVSNGFNNKNASAGTLYNVQLNFTSVI